MTPTGERGATPAERRVWMRRLRLVFGLAGLCFAVLAFRSTAGEIGDELDLSAGWIALLVLLAAVAAASAATAWSLIVGSGDRSRLRVVYFSALIGKYIPGGVFQAAGQISMAAETGLGFGRSASGYVMSIAAAVASGLISTIGLALVPQFHPMVRVLGVAGCIVGILLVVSPWLDAIRRFVARRIADPKLVVYANRRLMARAVLWNLVGLVSLSIGYAVSLRLFSSSYSVAMAVAGFAASWVVGFLAIPFPAGIGVREGMLVALLGSHVGVGVALGASLVTRLAVIAAEVMLSGYGALSRRRSSRMQSPAAAPSDEGVCDRNVTEDEGLV